ncbi:MAG: hypothetical protein JTJ17_01115 [Streptococcus gordonii]|nr:hypothetical protein [Streptococcus gordonii]
MKKIRRLCLSFCLSICSFSPGLVLYLFTIDIFPSHDSYVFSLFKIVVLVLLMFSFSFGILKRLIKFKEANDTAQVESIQPVENEIIPTYLGLFVIMLGLGELTFLYQVVVIALIFLIWWILMERSYYFNLIWLLSYRYYRVTDKNGNVFIIYSKKKDVKETGNIKGLVRINNFTFLEKE